MHIISIPLIQVISTALIMFIVGVLWYSPIVFGHMYKRLSGVTSEMKPVGKKMYITFGLAFLGNVVMSYVLGIVIINSVVFTLIQGMMIGFWMWLGFIAPVFLSQYLWATHKKPLVVYLIDLGQLLVTLLIGSAILSLII
jgi:hypothetical protein